MNKFAVPTPYGFTATRKSDRPYRFVVVYACQPRGYRPSDRPGTFGWSQSATGAAKMARAAATHFDGVVILPVAVTSKVAWTYPLSKPDYIQGKIDFHLQRQRHAREAPPDCKCLYCRSSAEIEALIRERIRLERLLIGEPPF